MRWTLFSLKYKAMAFIRRCACGLKPGWSKVFIWVPIFILVFMIGNLSPRLDILAYSSKISSMTNEKIQQMASSMVRTVTIAAMPDQEIHVKEEVVPTTPRPIMTDKPIRVLLLTYQRSGSTFLGQIFNHNPAAFYVFEPLDGLYAAIYGTSAGFNSPSDIVQTWAGQKRTLPDFEVRSTGVAVDNLLTCNHGDLPTEMLLHVFWPGYKNEQLASLPYTKCITQEDIKQLFKCKSKISKICRTWFGQKGAEQEVCRKNLWNDTSPGISGSSNSKVKVQFNTYHTCTAALRKQKSPCYPLLNKTCQDADIRAVKVVRMSMQAAQYLLEQKSEDLKIVHLIRDPKAVATSRMKYESVRGHFANKNKVKEADILCQTISEDLILRKKLEMDYPHSFYQVIYEEFLKDPVGSTQEIYNFLGKTAPETLLDYMLLMTSPDNKKPISGLSYYEAVNIDKICHEVYTLLNHTWPINVQS